MSDYRKYGPNEQVPSEVWRDLAGTYDAVSLRILRRNERGQLQTVYSKVDYKTADMVNLESFLRPRSGGGTYEVHVRRADDNTITLLIFHTSIAGAPRPPMPLEEPRRGLGGVVIDPEVAALLASDPEQDPSDSPFRDADDSASPRPTTEPDHVTNQRANRGPMPSDPIVHSSNTPTTTSDRWSEGLPPSERKAYRATGLSTIPSDQLAIHAASEHKERAARLEAELQAARQREQQLAAEFTQKLEELRKQNDETRQRAEREALEARHRQEIRDAEARLAEKFAASKPAADASAAKPSLTEVATVIAAIAAPIVSLVQSGQQAQAQRAEAESKRFEALIANLVASKSDPASTMRETIALMSSIQPRDNTESMARMHQVLAETQASTAAMYAQLLDSMAHRMPESSNSSMVSEVIPAVFEGLGALVSLWQSSSQQPPQPKALPPLVQHSPVAASPGQVTTQAPHRRYETTSTVEDHVKQSSDIGSDMTAPAMTPNLNAIFALMPQSMRTEQWTSWIRRVHEGRSSHALGRELSVLLIESLKAGILPEAMVDAFKENPTQLLQRIAAGLPMRAKHPDYIDSIIFHTMKSLDELVKQHLARANADAPSDAEHNHASASEDATHEEDEGEGEDEGESNDEPVPDMRFSDASAIDVSAG